MTRLLVLLAAVVLMAAPLSWAQDVTASKISLGVRYAPVNEPARKVANRPLMKGVIVVGIEQDSVADRAELRIGDVILEIAGIAIEANTASLPQALAQLRPGTVVSFLIFRDRKEETVQVKWNSALKETYDGDISVFGLKLNTALNLPECPFKMSGSHKDYEQSPNQTCVQIFLDVKSGGKVRKVIVFSAEERPDFILDVRMWPIEIDGRLMGLKFNTPGVRAQELPLARLSEKYGKPDTIDRRTVQNLQGASFEAITATWKSGDVSVYFEGVTNNLERGEITIELPDVIAGRKSQESLRRALQRKL